MQHRLVHWICEYYETLFQQIDRDNWEVFKEKLSGKVLGICKRARISIIGKTQRHSPMYPKFQGFDCFSEVHGYFYLKEKKRCEKVTFLQKINTTLKKTSDLKGIKGNSTIILDLKTINTSDDLHAYFERVVRDEKKTPEEESIDLDYPMTKKFVGV